MDQIKWTTHKSIKICDVDYSGLNEIDLIPLIKNVEKSLLSISKKNILIILHVNNILASDPVLQAFKNTSRNLQPSIDKVAILGLRGIKKLYLSAIIKITGIEAKAFDDIKNAKDWLVS